MKNDVSLPKWQPHSIESEQELLAFNIRDLAFQRQLMNIGVELECNIPIDVMQVATDAIDAIDAIVAEHGMEIEAKYLWPRP